MGGFPTVVREAIVQLAIRAACVVVLIGSLECLLTLSASADALEETIRAGVVAHATRDYDRAIKLYTSALGNDRISDQQRVEVLGFRALSYQASKQNARAEEDLTTAINLAPSKSDLYAQRGFIYLRDGRFAEARADFERGATLNPNAAIIQYGLGRVLSAQREYAGAVNQYTHAILLDSRISIFYLWRAEAHVILKQHQDAIADYQRALALGTLSPDETAQVNLGRGYLYLETNRTELAIRDFDEVLRFNPRSVKALKWRAWAYDKRQNCEMALHDYERILAIEPRNAQVIERVKQLKSALEP